MTHKQPGGCRCASRARGTLVYVVRISDYAAGRLPLRFGRWGRSAGGSNCPSGSMSRLPGRFLPDVLQDAVQLIEAVVAYDQFASAFPRVVYANLGTQLLRHLDFQATDVPVDRRSLA